MAIKMRENKDQNSVCENCNAKWKNVYVMYDLFLVSEKYTICKDCLEILFQKLLSASCKYNAKVKSVEDMARIRRHDAKKINAIFSKISINGDTENEQ